MTMEAGSGKKSQENGNDDSNDGKTKTEGINDYILGFQGAAWGGFYKKCKLLYHRDREYWEFWNETYWNPGPFLNRNANNMFVAFFSISVSVVYLMIGITLDYTGKLRFVQDETQYRTVAKLNFDLLHIHFLNIASCVGLAAATFFTERSLERVFIAAWLLTRFLFWLNSARNLKHFLARPHAYVLYNPSNPQWKWQFLSGHISYWCTVVYWVFLVLEWTYEWTIVIVYFYLTSLKTRITTAVIPEPLYRIQDTAFTEPCNPKKEYKLLCPTPQPWKNPNNKQLFGRQPLMIKTDNRFRRVP